MDPAEAKLAILDVETTGLSPAMGDHIVEIDLVIYRGGQEIDRLSRLVNPDQPIPMDARRVHGISDRDVAIARLSRKNDDGSPFPAAWKRA